MMDPSAMVDLLNGGGVLAMFVILFVFGYRGIWVWGRELKKAEKERDLWRELALRGTQIADRAVDLAEQRRTS